VDPEGQKSGGGSGTAGSASGLQGLGSRRGREARARAGEYVCTFWNAGECFALDTVLVAEVVAVARVTPVPLSPSWLLGLHNLRGTPLVIADLFQVLDLPGGGSYAGGPMDVLVLRTAAVLVGIRIERIGAVHGYDGVVRESAAAPEHPAVKGLLKIASRGGQVATLLDEGHVSERLAALRLRRPAEGAPGEASEGAKFHG